MDICSLEQALAQNLSRESGANQVSGAVFGGIVSGANGESDEDRLRFCGESPNRFQLQRAAKISAILSVSQIKIARLVL